MVHSLADRPAGITLPSWIFDLHRVRQVPPCLTEEPGALSPVISQFELDIVD